MANFMSTDRKRILLSALLGSTIIALCGFLTDINDSLNIAVGIVVFFAYFLLPFLINSAKGITSKDDKYFNVDGEDFTNRLPKPWWAMLTFVICMICSWFVTDGVHTFLMNLGDTDNTPDWLVTTSAIFSFILPYLVVHSYFFIKNLPVSFIFAICGTNSNYSDSSHIPHIPILEDPDRYCPTRSYNPINIWHIARGQRH